MLDFFTLVQIHPRIRLAWWIDELIFNIQFLARKTYIQTLNKTLHCPFRALLGSLQAVFLVSSAHSLTDVFLFFSSDSCSSSFSAEQQGLPGSLKLTIQVSIC